MPTLIVLRRNSGRPLRRLLAEHPRLSHVFYLDVPYEETVRRNLERGFTAEQTRGWYAPDDRLGVPGERVLTASEDAVGTILHASGLVREPARTPCPCRCPRCAEKGIS